MIYHTVNDYGLYGSNSRHSIVTLNNERIISIYKGMHKNISDNCVRIFGSLKQFSHCLHIEAISDIKFQLHLLH